MIVVSRTREPAIAGGRRRARRRRRQRRGRRPRCGRSRPAAGRSGERHEEATRSRATNAGQNCPASPTIRPASAAPTTPDTTRVAWASEFAARSPLARDDPRQDRAAGRREERPDRRLDEGEDVEEPEGRGAADEDEAEDDDRPEEVRGEHDPAPVEPIDVGPRDEPDRQRRDREDDRHPGQRGGRAGQGVDEEKEGEVRQAVAGLADQLAEPEQPVRRGSGGSARTPSGGGAAGAVESVIGMLLGGGRGHQQVVRNCCLTKITRFWRSSGRADRGLGSGLVDTGWSRGAPARRAGCGVHPRAARRRSWLSCGSSVSARQSWACRMDIRGYLRGPAGSSAFWMFNAIESAAPSSRSPRTVEALDAIPSPSQPGVPVRRAGAGRVPGDAQGRHHPPRAPDADVDELYRAPVAEAAVERLHAAFDFMSSRISSAWPTATSR